MIWAALASVCEAWYSPSALMILIDLLAVGEQLVQRGLSECGSQRCLRDLGGRVDVVEHLSDGSLRIDDLEIDDGVDLRGHVVVRDDLLRGHFERDHAEVDLDEAIDAERDDEEQTWAFERDQAAQPKNHPALVFVRDAQAGEDDDEQQHHDYAQNHQRADVHQPPSFFASVSPGTT